MANAGLVWDGLKEFKEELAKLPDACEGEAGRSIEGGVNAAYVTISGEYGAHRVSGDLQKKLKISAVKGGLTLTSGSTIAWVFDNGSQARHWKRNGKYVGRMPPTHIFSRTVGKTRRTLAGQFAAMLIRQGAKSVTVTADA